MERIGRRRGSWRQHCGSKPSGITGRTGRQRFPAPGRTPTRPFGRPATSWIFRNWLDKNEREWEEFGMTRFLPDAFFETVPFERLEIEYIDPDAPKKKSKDPRNAF